MRVVSVRKGESYRLSHGDVFLKLPLCLFDLDNALNDQQYLGEYVKIVDEDTGEEWPLSVSTIGELKPGRLIVVPDWAHYDVNIHVVVGNGVFVPFSILEQYYGQLSVGMQYPVGYTFIYTLPVIGDPMFLSIYRSEESANSTSVKLGGNSGDEPTVISSGTGTAKVMYQKTDRYVGMSSGLSRIIIHNAGTAQSSTKLLVLVTSVGPVVKVPYFL